MSSFVNLFLKLIVHGRFTEGSDLVSKNNALKRGCEYPAITLSFCNNSCQGDISCLNSRYM